MPKHRSLRLQDVAKVAGVHPATASRALSDHTVGLLSPETAERVRQVAEQLGYRANRMARALKTQRSSAIGIIIPDITNPFFPPVVKGAEATLADADHTLVLANTDNDEAKEHLQLLGMLQSQVDGLLLVAPLPNDKLVDELQRRGVPLTLVNHTTDHADARGISAAISDDLQGVTLAVDHLLNLGHRRIAYVGSPLDVSSNARRSATFAQVARTFGLADAVIVEEAAFDEAAGYRAAAKLFDCPPRPTAIVAGNDLMALGVLDAAAGRSLQCPHDVSIVGFNDLPFADRFKRPLTTVRVAKHELGRRAAECLLALIKDPGRLPKTVVIAPELVVRTSTGPVDCR